MLLSYEGVCIIEDDGDIDEDMSTVENSVDSGDDGTTSVELKTESVTVEDAITDDDISTDDDCGIELELDSTEDEKKSVTEELDMLLGVEEMSGKDELVTNIVEEVIVVDVDVGAINVEEGPTVIVEVDITEIVRKKRLLNTLISKFFFFSPELSSCNEVADDSHE